MANEAQGQAVPAPRITRDIPRFEDQDLWALWVGFCVQAVGKMADIDEPPEQIAREAAAIADAVMFEALRRHGSPEYIPGVSMEELRRLGEEIFTAAAAVTCTECLHHGPNKGNGHSNPACRYA